MGGNSPDNSNETSPHKQFPFKFNSSLLISTHNAALRGEQRMPPKLSHCAVNTKADSNQNCQAL
ncbi:hypothetical protein SN13_20080 [Vibrio alginolyticus]|nr:hypothetical protein SN12_21500 [Vibrio alginolyticus]KIP81048.1 hypothetical protein SN13_20080 [Vibrio alginolyticus]